MFNTVLLPIDLAAESSWSRALPAALRLAEPADLTLHVVAVVPDFGMSVVGSFFEEGFEEHALARTGDALRAWVDAHVPEGTRVHPHVAHGRVYDEVIRAADRLKVDAIVMGAHTPELSDYLLGPNAARVVRHARQSVFVVRGT